MPRRVVLPRREKIEMISKEPKEMETAKVQSFLLGGVAPRPIALVSTLSVDGIPNLAPFSFFNAFGANPPMIAFSPSNRVRDNTTKDTLTNIEATGECVVQAVTFDIVHQVSLASMEYPADINEFDKSGLTPVKSDLVKPFRVAESPFQMECKLNQIIPLGDQAGSGNLILCEVVKFHVDPDIIVDGVIEPDRAKLVARLSADYYVTGHGLGLFQIDKPGKKKGIGYDQLPAFVRSSNLLTANHLGQLAAVEKLPSPGELETFMAELLPIDYCSLTFYEYEARGDYQAMFQMALASDSRCSPGGLSLMIKAGARALDHADIDFAWKALLMSQEPVRKHA